MKRGDDPMAKNVAMGKKKTRDVTKAAVFL